MATKKLKQIIELGIKSFIIILAFTAIDYLFHTYTAHAVPSYYFTNKVLFGTAYLFLALVLMPRKLSIITKSAIATAATVLLLQTRYLFAYSLKWNAEVVLAHLIILGAITYLAYKSKVTA